MLGKLTGWDDTIVALATPPGIGAIGVIRLSGPASWSIVDRLFPSKNLAEQPSHTLHVGLLREGEETLDEVVVSLFRGPRSYTGEDVVEVSCHGSPYVQERVIQSFLRQGARLAKAGEFTQRAFLNGRLDLTQAEAVADLIASNTAASARTALHSIRGGFGKDLQELRVRLLSFSALIELELDFSQEDVEFADRTQLYQLIREAEQETAALLSSFRLGNVIRNGVQVAIVGKPNAGKSTLLNTLLNENRAIVSEIAGTTRDTIEETLNIDGILFRLIDTAGIRHHTTDLIENLGMEKSLEKMAQADIVVYLFDAGDEVEEVMGRKREVEGTVDARGAVDMTGTVGEMGAAGTTDAVGISGTVVTTGAVDMTGTVGTTDAMVTTGAMGTTGTLGMIEATGTTGTHMEGSQATGMPEATNKLNAGDKPDAGIAVPDVNAVVSPGAGGMASTGDSGMPSTGTGKRFLWVGNKVDRLVGEAGFTTDDATLSENIARRKFHHIPDAIFISAKQHKHIDLLKQRLVDQVLQGHTSTEGTIVTNARHYHALQQVARSLETIHRGLDELLPGDLLALDIRHCLHYLGEITGEITSEDRLDYIFSKFCIGK